MVNVARRVARAALLCSVLGIVGCLDGPLPRINPNDPGADVTLSLVASRDTLRPGAAYVLVQVLSDPPTLGYAPRWEVEPDGTLIHLGDGLFLMMTAPAAPEPTTIHADFATRRISTTVVRAP